VSIAKTMDGNETGPVSGEFRDTRTKASTVDTVVNFTLTGTALEGSDLHNGSAAHGDYPGRPDDGDDFDPDARRHIVEPPRR